MNKNIFNDDNDDDNINGKEDNTKNDTTGGVAFSANLSLGGHSWDRYFNGLIDDVRVYNYARTTEQIYQDYNGGLSTHFK